MKRIALRKSFPDLVKIYSGTLSFAMIASQSPTFSSVCTEPDVALSIVCLADRAGGFADTATAVLQIKLTNHSKTNTRICFSWPRGAVHMTGSGLEQVDTKPIHTYFLSNDSNVASGLAFATIEYQWIDEKGALVSSGLYTLSNTNMADLNEGQSIALNVPVSLPNRSGQYDFVVRFDNRSLRPVAATYYMTPLRMAFFERDARVQIKLPDQK